MIVVTARALMQPHCQRCAVDADLVHRRHHLVAGDVSGPVRNAVPRPPGRVRDIKGSRSGYYGRTLITRVGKLELRVPQDRTGRFSTELFERYQRSERALVAALSEMYVQGVSTRKAKAITEELCGHSFSASSISAMNQRLDASLAQFAAPLGRAFPYLILDARYERVREAGVIASQAVLIAIGIDWDGRRQVLAVELANRESRSSWRDFLLGLKARGLHGVEFVVADDHPGLRAALRFAVCAAGIYRMSGKGWFRSFDAGHVSLGQLKVMSAIESCRSAALGGHVERCEECGYRRIAYNSCRNRHCPKCQGAAAKDWLAAREADLLPVGYFHLVFTVPAKISAANFPGCTRSYLFAL